MIFYSRKLKLRSIVSYLIHIIEYILIFTISYNSIQTRTILSNYHIYNNKIQNLNLLIIALILFYTVAAFFILTI